MGDLRRELKLEIDPETGPILRLDDWEHRDYIEDVLAEHFGMEYEYLIEDENSGKHMLYFCDSVSLSDLEQAIKAINTHHASSVELYDVV